MRSLMFLLVLSITPALVQGADDPTKKNDAKNIQGKWTIVDGWKKGRKIDKQNSDFNMEWDITTDSIILSHPTKQKTETAGYALMPGKKTNAIDISPEKGGTDKVLGIYELKGDTLKICFAMSGERPTKFDAPEGSKLTYVILKRKK